MTPKENAQYLFDIYTNYVGEYDVSKHAKQCAIIAVDEIIEVLSKDLNPLVNYWFEVKQEIESL